MKTFKSVYSKYNKIGHYDESGIKNILFNEINNIKNINRNDMIEIANRTKYNIEAAIVNNGSKHFYIEGINRNRVDIKTALIYESDIIHSHPNGTSLSAEDIVETITFQGKSITAFNDNYIYIFRNNIVEDTDFMNLFNITLSEIEGLLIKKVNNGTITKSQMDFSMNHKVWLEMSKKLKGFDYESYKISR